MHIVQPFLFILLFVSCNENDSVPFSENRGAGKLQSFESIKAIPVPEGYERLSPCQDSFGKWLGNIRFKKDNRVRLYNGDLKKNQSGQFAVLDIPVGKKDLQQCADAVMRLRAEYLFSSERYDEIWFSDNAGTVYRWTKGNDRNGFEKYLERVFGWCGSASLEKQLKKVSSIRQIEPGDVFIKGGFPGHAMIVADVAINKAGKKLFMLAQSYMPAQDIHIVINPANKTSPWYEAGEMTTLITPDWVFGNDQLRRW